MKKVKVKIAGDGSEENPFTVNLPTWLMIGDIDKDKKNVEVYLPDDEVDDKGKINEKRIREKYKKNWSKFKKEDVEG